MSIYIVYLSPTSVTVGVDTEGRREDGSAVSVSKAIPLVHMNAIIAYRGSALFLSILFICCHQQGGEFDALVDRMPGIIQETQVAARQAAQTLGITDQSILDKHDIVLAGWSSLAGRMVAYKWSVENGDTEATQRRSVNTWICGPWDASLPEPIPHRGTEDMIRMASAQVRLLHEKEPKASAGGRLIVAHITRKGMHIASVADLPTRSGDTA